MSDADSQEWRRRATALIGEEMIHSILDLPDGVRVIGVRGDWLRMGVEVMMEGDIFAPVAPGTEPTSLPIEWQYDADEQRLRFVPPVTAQDTP